MIPKIESFEETNAKFSIIPNSIFDILASSDLNPYETKILVIIARNTYGWRADFDEISVSQFMGTDEQGKSTMSKPTVLKSLKSLEEKGLILSCLFVVNNVQKKVYFINTDESAKMVNLIKSGAIKYSELKSYRLHKIANQKSSFNLVNHIDRVNHVDGGSQSPLPGGSTTLTGVVNLVDGGSQSPLPTKNNLNYSLNNNLNNNLNFNTPFNPPQGETSEVKKVLCDRCSRFKQNTQDLEGKNYCLTCLPHEFEERRIITEAAISTMPQKQIQQPTPQLSAPPPLRLVGTLAGVTEAEIAEVVDRHVETVTANPQGFDEFWAQYPAKVAKPAALKAWRKLKPSPELQATIQHDIAKRKQTDRKWLEGFIANPATYLNQARWADQVEVLATTDTSSEAIRRPNQPMSQHEKNMIELKKYAEKHGVNF